jgi:hypothetical protein
MSIVLSANSHSTTLDNPVFPYSTDIEMAMIATRHADNSISWWDNGKTHDRRTCKCNLLMNNTQIAAMNGFISDSSKGRAENISLALTTGNGFFPFGPDMGDGSVGGVDFVCGVSYKEKGRILETQSNPYHAAALELELISAPSFSVVDTNVDGNLQIGATTHIRFPQGGYEVNPTYQYSRIVSLGGTEYYVDRGSGADTFESAFTISGTTTKIAALLYQLINVIRGNQFNIVAASNNWPLGYDQGASGTFACKLLKPVLSVTHTRYNNFELRLEVIVEAGSFVAT